MSSDKDLVLSLLKALEDGLITAGFTRDAEICVNNVSVMFSPTGIKGNHLFLKHYVKSSSWNDRFAPAELRAVPIREVTGPDDLVRKFHLAALRDSAKLYAALKEENDKIVVAKDAVVATLRQIMSDIV